MTRRLTTKQRERFTVYQYLDGEAAVQRDGEHFMTVANICGARLLAALCNSADNIANQSAIIAGDPEFQREKIAAAVAKAMGYYLENPIDRKARLEAEQAERAAAGTQ